MREHVLLGEQDLFLFNEGTHVRLYEKLAAHPLTVDGETGTYFAVWAPNADQVSVMGAFNAWDKTSHPLVPRGQSGVWERFFPGIGKGTSGIMTRAWTGICWSRRRTPGCNAGSRISTVCIGANLRSTNGTVIAPGSPGLIVMTRTRAS